MEEARTGESIEVGVKLLAVDSECEIGVEFSGGFGVAIVEGGEDVLELAGLLCGGLAEGLRGGVLGGAEVAVAAGAQAVGGVAEVLDQGVHAALRRFGVGDDAVDLERRKASCWS